MEIKQKAIVEVLVNGEEAKKELQSLESYANNLKGRLTEARNTGDTKKIKQLEKELRETNGQLKVMRTNARNIDVAMNNIGLATPKELRKLLKDINSKLNSGHIKRGSAEWRKYQEQLKLVSNELRKIKNEVVESEGWLTRFNNGFTKWGALVTSAIAGITGLTFTIRKATAGYAEMEEAESQVIKYTGMTKEQVKSLNEDLKKMDTRTARERLNALAGDAGRLGKTSKKDVLDFIDAADKINVALGEDLGEDAVKNIGKLAMMFGEDKEKGLKGAMLATGSAINAVGQTSSAAEPYLVDFTARVAGAANQAKISQADIIGFASVLDQNMIRDEKAATAFQNVIMKMYQEPAKFAKIAGKDITEFTQLLKTDANEAILQFLQSLNKKGSLAQLAPLFDKMKLDGQGAASVLSVLAGKIEGIRVAQKTANEAYNDGTSIIEEFNVQNNTIQAGIDKSKKKFADLTIELGEKLLPIARYGISTGSLTIKVLSKLVDFSEKYGGTIAWLSILILTYMTRVKIAAAYQAILNTVTMTATIVSGAYTLASVALNDALAGDYKALSRFAAQMAKTNIVAKVVTASTLLYRAAIELLTFRLKGATTAMKAFWSVMQVSKGGLLFTAIAAAITISYKWNKSIREHYNLQSALNKLHEKAADLYNSEKEKMKKLWNIIHDNNKSLSDRRTAILELQKIMPEYQAQISQEGKVINETTQDLNDMNEALNRNIKLKMLRDELFARYKAIETLEKSPALKDNSLMGSMAREDVRTKIAEEKAVLEGLKKEYSELYKEKFKKENNKPATVVPEPKTKEDKEEEEEKKRLERLKKAFKNVEAAAAKEEALIKEKYAKGETTYRDYCKAINDNDIKELDKKMALYDQESNEYNQLLTKKQDLLKKGLEQETNFTIDEIEARAKEEEMSLVSSYYNQKISRFALNEGLFRLDIEALQKKQALYTKDSKEWHEYEKLITNSENKEKLRKQEEYQKLLSSIRKEYSKKDLDQLMQDELDGIEYLHKNGLLKEEEYWNLIKVIRKKYLKEKIDQVDENTPEETGKSPLGNEYQKLKEKYALIQAAEERNAISHQEALRQKAEADSIYLDSLKEKTEAIYSSLSSIVTAYSNYTNACQDLEVAKVEKKYNAEIEAAGANTAKGKKLEEQKEKEVARIKSKHNKKAMKIEVAQALASTAMSAINAYNSALHIPIIGLTLAPIAAAVAFAAGMLQVSTIKKQHQAQELGYYSGGFTPLNSDSKKEVGVVHANEFIANHKAVNNPALSPVLQLIDSAQKNNTVGSLTAEDVSVALGKGRAYSISPAGSSVTENEKTELVLGLISNSMNRTSEVIEGLAAILDDGIESYVTIDGERGFEKQYNHYKRLKANKSR